MDICITQIISESVSSRRVSHTHSRLYFHCSPLFSHMHTNSCILKAAHTHASTSSEPDLYLLLYPVSVGTPCPAHMIAPFPGPLLPAFTLFPWQLSFKWVEPLLSARLVKNSLPKSDSGNQLSLSPRFSLLLKSFRCHRCFPSDCWTHLLFKAVRPAERTYMSTHILGVFCCKNTLTVR